MVLRVHEPLEPDMEYTNFEFVLSQRVYARVLRVHEPLEPDVEEDVW